ncbi:MULTISPECIES: hypothetical protein [unclassified Legionella]|uniref:hypothetical protein n=1 Tax=unclassified Legionella TaxID=2622702 RepID=UPI0010541F23|nr:MULTISPECIES: hypothetical protein [unclassified Legionella]MDI9818913.1 hypothetical protein [Legionella sp. PL877]
MTFHIPPMQILLKTADKLNPRYEELRKAKDEKRWFASFRPATKNPQRFEQIEFVKTVAADVKVNKASYGSINQQFANKNYEADVAPHLRQVVAGAFLMDLIIITRSYGGNEEAVKDGSVLGKIILDLFGIDKLSEVPAGELKACLKALDGYLYKMDDLVNEDKKQPIQWHPKKTNIALRAEIAKEIEKINEELGVGTAKVPA